MKYNLKGMKEQFEQFFDEIKRTNHNKSLYMENERIAVMIDKRDIGFTLCIIDHVFGDEFMEYDKLDGYTVIKKVKEFLSN